MLNIVLVEPEIPPNCGNVARTCAATGARLHLVEPLGFDISDRAVKRAGLDYWHLVEVAVYRNLDDLFAKHPEAGSDCWLATTKAPRPYTEAQFRDNCWLFFGKETAGLPEDFRMRYFDRCIRLPIRAEARSLNLSNSVAVVTSRRCGSWGSRDLCTPERWRAAKRRLWRKKRAAREKAARSTRPTRAWVAMPRRCK